MTGKQQKAPLLRERSVSFLLNEAEYKALQRYCTKYNIKNRSRFMRESVMRAVLTRLTEDYPTLFGENEMH